MKHSVLRPILVGVLMVVVGGCTPSGLMQSPGRAMIRTELYLGMTVPGGADVTVEQFEQFMEQVVAPRFPQGHTVVDAQGRWREASGMSRIEPTRVLIVLHPGDGLSHRRIEEIRRAYKQRFAQEAVMRVDDDQKVAF